MLLSIQDRDWLRILTLLTGTWKSQTEQRVPCPENIIFVIKYLGFMKRGSWDISLQLLKAPNVCNFRWRTVLWLTLVLSSLWMLSSVVKDSFLVWSKKELLNLGREQKRHSQSRWWVIQVIFKNLPAHANASCVKPLIAHGTQNGVLVITDGLLTFAAGELYASLGGPGLGWTSLESLFSWNEHIPNTS